jgi:hypothetical protein
MRHASRTQETFAIPVSTPVSLTAGLDHVLPFEINPVRAENAEDRRWRFRAGSAISSSTTGVPENRQDGMMVTDNGPGAHASLRQMGRLEVAYATDFVVLTSLFWRAGIAVPAV